MLNPGGELAGVGHYTTGLVDAMTKQHKSTDFVLFFDHKMSPDSIAELRERDNVTIRRFPLSKHKKYLPIAYSHGFVSQTLKSAKLDLFHSPAYTIPLRYNKPSVVTVHDLAIYDHPEWFPDGQKFSRQVAVPSSLKKSAKVIAVSEATQKQVCKLFGRTKADVPVIYEGFNKGKQVNKKRRAELRSEHGIGEQYLFFVSTIEPRKNVVRLVKAFDAFMEENHKRFPQMQLVLAGKQGWKSKESIRAIARAKWSGHIRMLGYITHEEKVAFMQDAVAFVFPSLWEGFGLPVLEALQLGTPVVTSKRSALPEVAGPGAEYINPRSVKDIHRGIQAVVRSPKRAEKLAIHGKEHVQQFTWKKAATETIAIYTEVLQD